MEDSQKLFAGCTIYNAPDFLFYFSIVKPLDWLAYMIIFSIMITSLVNQYFRVGSFEFRECNTLCTDPLLSR